MNSNCRGNRNCKNKTSLIYDNRSKFSLFDPTCTWIFQLQNLFNDREGKHQPCKDKLKHSQIAKIQMKNDQKVTQFKFILF